MGCPNTDARVKNPTPKDIEGVWEALYDNSTIPYLLLRMDDKGIGKVIGAGDEGAGKIFDLHSFETLQKSFFIIAELATDEEDADDEVMKFEGTLSDGLLCFASINPDEEAETPDAELNICFARFKKLAEYRKSALAIGDELLL